MATARALLWAACLAACRDRTQSLLPLTTEEADCGLIATFQPAPPDSLLETFLRRDWEGEFLSHSAWFDSVTSCPAHEPGPDAFEVVARMETRTTRPDPQELVAALPITFIGWIDSDSTGTSTFHPRIRVATDTIILDSTRFGWRIRSPALRQRVGPEASMRLLKDHDPGRDSLLAQAQRVSRGG